MPLIDDKVSRLIIFQSMLEFGFEYSYIGTFSEMMTAPFGLRVARSNILELHTLNVFQFFFFYLARPKLKRGCFIKQQQNHTVIDIHKLQ
jgi:hypothetical protein